MPFGAHMPVAGGVYKAFAHGEHVGCEVMQIFSKNQRQWNAKPYTEKDIEKYKAEEERTGIGPVVVHTSYLINLASPDDALWEKSIAALSDEMERSAALGIAYVVLHPGSHTGSGEEQGLSRIADALNRIFDEGTADGVMVLLETTAGQGTNLGASFEHLAHLLRNSRYPERLGVCVDTCHIFAAGYDMRTREAYDATFAAFDQIVGLQHIKVFHLNDSQHDLDSRKDRHAHIGKGYLGEEAFRLLVNDSRFHQLPMILETPKGKDLAEDIENLSLLRSLVTTQT
jgi:deoxyribonuclease-4